MLLDIFITALLVFLNGFFVAAEFAIVKVRASQIQVRRGKSFNARIAESVIDHLDAYLAATQLGITLASLGLGWIGESVVSEIILRIMDWMGVAPDPDLAHSIALPIAFLVITILHIVFGELAPKSLAIRYPTNTTLWVASPLRLFYIVFSPFIWLLNGFANFLLKTIGIRPIAHADIHSEEELKLIIAESAEGGAIHSTERELIQNVFDFDDRAVRHVLKPRMQIVAFKTETTIEEAVETALSEGYSRYPIYDDSIDNIKGFVTTKDLLANAYKKTQKPITELMRPVIFAHSNQKIQNLLRKFQREHAQLAIVVNEFGGTVGIVTMEDILEELVGEIQDEYDAELPIVEQISDTVYRVLAQNPINEINEFLPEPLPVSNEYLTLSGLILKTKDEIPTEGQAISIGKYDAKIETMFYASPEVVTLTWKSEPTVGNKS